MDEFISLTKPLNSVEWSTNSTRIIAIAADFTKCLAGGVYWILGMRSERNTGVGTKKGRALKTLTKLLNSRVDPFYIREMGSRDCENETNQKNKRTVISTGKAANFQTSTKIRQI